MILRFNVCIQSNLWNVINLFLVICVIQTWAGFLLAGLYSAHTSRWLYRRVCLLYWTLRSYRRGNDLKISSKLHRKRCRKRYRSILRARYLDRFAENVGRPVSLANYGRHYKRVIAFTSKPVEKYGKTDRKYVVCAVPRSGKSTCGFFFFLTTGQRYYRRGNKMTIWLGVVRQCSWFTLVMW